MKRVTVIGLILAMTLTLGACGGKDSSGAASSSQGAEVSSVSQETDGDAAGFSAEDGGADPADGNIAAAGENMTASGADETAADADMTAAGVNMTEAGADVTAAGANMTAAGGNMTAAGGKPTAGNTPSTPVILDPPSMKTAYQPETEEQKYAREITGIYLLTDLKDALSDDTGARASQLAAEGNPMYLEFFPNGTVRETVFGDPMGGLWDKEYLTLGSDRVPYEFSGDHVMIATDTMDLTFTRTTQEELDLLLESGKDTGSADGEAAADGEIIADGEAVSGTETADGTTAGGTGKKRREERIIKVGSQNKDEEEDGEGSEDGEENAEGSGADETDLSGNDTEDPYMSEDTYGTDADDAYTNDDIYETGADDGSGLDDLSAEQEDTAAQQIEDNIIVDDLCGMYVTGYDFSDPRGFVIHVRCENYSIYNLAFNINYAVVNNVMFEPGTPEGDDYWTLEVGPLSNRESDIIFSAEKTAEYGLTSFDYVMLGLWVRNIDNWMDDPIYIGDEELYPGNNVTANGEGIHNVERRAAAGEQKIAEESKFNFTILGSEVRPNGDYVLKICIENKTWQNLTFNWDDVYVNGTLLDPFWAVETLPGTICYDDVIFTADNLAEKGVSSVSDVSFTMSVWDSKDWLSYAIYTKESTYRA